MSEKTLNDEDFDKILELLSKDKEDEIESTIGIGKKQWDAIKYAIIVIIEGEREVPSYEEKLRPALRRFFNL